MCPVKYCIDGSGDTVTINHDLCIGCGSCIKACTHDTRRPIDDLAAFLAAVDSSERMVAVAESIADISRSMAAMVDQFRAQLAAAD